MYIYEIEFVLANENVEFDFTGNMDDMRKVVSSFNDLGKSSENPKKITKIDPINNGFILTLESMEKLMYPSRALGGFTRKLLATLPELLECLQGKRLLKSTRCEELNVDSDFATDMTDIESLQLLVEIFLNKSKLFENKLIKRDNAKEKITEILLEYKKKTDINDYLSKSI